jgi:hypothetical protein
VAESGDRSRTPSPSPTDGGTAIPVSDASSDAVDDDQDGEPTVDVDAELDTIRREVHGDDDASE